MTPSSIGVCCDCGEDPAFVADGRQEALLAFVTHASVACGGHAGDDDTMRATVRQCVRAGVTLGAHPSYADREGFGRRRVETDARALEDSLVAQVARLASICAEEGARLEYVKPHGQLYHDVERDDAALRALVAAARAAGGVPLMVRARSPAIEALARAGHESIAEAFADRGYTEDGALVPRGQPGALLDVDKATAQAERIAREGWARVLCVHGDGPHALAIARAVRAALDAQRGA